jgi:hypothetical protein
MLYTIVTVFFLESLRSTFSAASGRKLCAGVACLLTTAASEWRHGTWSSRTPLQCHEYVPLRSHGSPRQQRPQYFPPPFAEVWVPDTNRESAEIYLRLT